MPQPFHIVDAFTAEPFAGNPAAVYVLDELHDEKLHDKNLHGEKWPADVWLQCVAREMNQSETAFLVRSAGGFDLRWFTPLVEVDLCGHATLASAHVLWSTGAAEHNEPIAFNTRSGILTATQSDNRIELDFPLLSEQPTEVPGGLAEALGVTPIYVGKSHHDLLVEVATDAEVRSAQPNFTRLAAISTRGVIVTARSSDPTFDFVSRFFAPAAGINEDPVTGSAHCCLADFWRKRLSKDTFRAYQASPRGGVVHVRVVGDRAVLGGQAVTVACGELICGR
jgi:PhzF family phenazine biosynthesis protein